MKWIVKIASPAMAPPDPAVQTERLTSVRHAAAPTSTKPATNAMIIHGASKPEGTLPREIRIAVNEFASIEQVAARTASRSHGSLARNPAPASA